MSDRSEEVRPALCRMTGAGASGRQRARRAPSRAPHRPFGSCVDLRKLESPLGCPWTQQRHTPQCRANAPLPQPLSSDPSPRSSKETSPHPPASLLAACTVVAPAVGCDRGARQAAQNRGRHDGSGAAAPLTAPRSRPSSPKGNFLFEVPLASPAPSVARPPGSSSPSSSLSSRHHAPGEGAGRTSGRGGLVAP